VIKNFTIPRPNSTVDVNLNIQYKTKPHIFKLKVPQYPNHAAQKSRIKNIIDGGGMKIFCLIKTKNISARAKHLMVYNLDT